MRAVILERNKQVSRRIARCFLAAGVQVATCAEPGELAGALEGADLLGADAFDGDAVLEALRTRRGLRAMLWTAEPLKRSLRYLIETKAIGNVLGRKDFDSAPRAWEIAMVLRRMKSGVGEPPPIGAYLAWGAAPHELAIGTTVGRDEAVARVQAMVAALQVPKRLAEMAGELAHELLMNALYDAPVDANGAPRFAQDRKSDIALGHAEQAVVRFGTDGNQVALQVRDPFGRLERAHVTAGLARGLSGGELDTRGGGAGLGMMVCHNASTALFFDVVRGHLTEVTATFELDLNLRELRTQARSLHWFER